MKNMRKIASVLLALVMVFALAAPVFAAETYSITINNATSGYTYEAYQIFSGDLHEGTLSNIQWGESVTNAADLPDAASVAERLDQNYEGEDKLTVDDLLAMVTLGDSVASTSTMTDGKYVISGLEPGYYLVKNTAVAAGGAYTEYIVKVVKNVETAPKADVPEFEKKVKDINDTTDTEYTDWQDSADHDIGDDVPFQLKATLADNVSAYDTYKVVFHDTLSDGLTFNPDSVVVKVDGTEIPSDAYTVNTNCADGCTFEVIINDVKAYGAGDSSVVTVEYTAELNENAVIGAEGNPNVANLEYSNNPNWVPEYEDDDDNPDTPDVPKNPEDSPTGETPEDKVIVFTYKVIVNKVDGNNEPLTGAEFTLEKYNEETGEWEAVAVAKDEAGTVFTFTGLDDGNYRLVETVTPAGYNSIDPIEFTVTAEHDIVSDDPRLTSLSGNATTGELTLTPDLTAGSLTGDVVNQAGVELPETGGMGTTLIYTLGAVMVLGAAVLLVTKKRMSAAE